MKRCVCSLDERVECFYQRHRYPAVEEAEASLLARQAALMLTDTQRQTLFLYLVEQMPIEDIASELGISKNAVYSRIHSLKKRLRRLGVFFG